MLDAVDPANIPAELDGKPALHITVLADPAGECFDVEAGNASPAEAASVMVANARQGRWAVGYVDWNLFPVLTSELLKRGMGWATARSFPAPGVYLWAADPDGNIAGGKWILPVVPVAVQTTNNGRTDTSETVDNFPAEVAGYIDGAASKWPADAWARFSVIGAPAPTPSPAPAPPPPPAPHPAPTSEVNVLLPVLSEQNPGPNVAAPVVANLQALLVHHGFSVGPAGADGRFGPATAAAVVEAERHFGLSVDAGIAGGQVWGALLTR